MSNASGVMGATISTAVSLLGLSALSPQQPALVLNVSAGPLQRCSIQAASLAAFGLVGAGAAGGLLMADDRRPEA